MKKIVIAVLFSAMACFASAQKAAIKTNLLYDATTTLNLGVEIGLGTRWTIEVAGNYIPWKYGNASWKHWLVQPEVRYWTCEKFNGHFFGLHGHYAQYNVGGIDFNPNLLHNRYQGYLYGAGISYGYQWIIGKRWNLEAVIGVGYARLHDDKYPIAECGTAVRTKSYNYFGPTKIGVTLVYLIK